MFTFLSVFGLFMLGACAVVSSPVPSGWGKRIFLFVVGVSLWAGAIIIVRTNEEVLMDLLLSDYALTGPFGAQVAATIFVFGMGWFVFVVSSVRTERKRPIRFEQAWYNAEDTVDVMKVFRPWPGILVWIPVGMILAAIWFVPAHFGGYGVEPDVTPTAMPSNTPIATAVPTTTTTATVMSTSTPTATPEPTATPSETPTATPEPTVTSEPNNTPDPSKPALACNGTWLHEEPFTVLSWTQLRVELCQDGERIAIHDNSGFDPYPTTLSSFSSKGERVEFYVQNGQVAVNGTPFAQWLAARGGR